MDTPDAALLAWIDAFNAHDVDRIAGLYDPQAVLWGTLSPVLIDDAPGVRGYFVRAFAQVPGLAVTLGDRRSRRWGDTAVVSGAYLLQLGAAPTAPLLPARFSFTWRRQGSAWSIVDHHSSALPDPAP